MNVIAWTALRQLEALRESVAVTLKDGALNFSGVKDLNSQLLWMKAQGFKVPVERDSNGELEGICIFSAMELFLDREGAALIGIAGNASRFISQVGDPGPKRSGAGWRDLPNFVTTSAFVRLLGAMEQFELDVLKTLLHYRPNGIAELDCGDIIEAKIEVALEKPNAEGEYRMPIIWTWLKRHVENNVERRKMFSRIFEIECKPAEDPREELKEIGIYYNDLYEKRNAIAHGRERVELSLADYCYSELFVMKLIENVAKQCAEKHRLAV